MTYAEKLKDPRWQRRRLEIMSAADFKCSDCGEGGLTLHVHHCYYQKGLMPWDYPGEALKCLCEYCHDVRQEVELIIQQELAEFSYDELCNFRSGVLLTMKAFGVDPIVKELDDAFGPELTQSQQSVTEV